MKPYSMDLRIRVLEAYKRKEGSIRKLAKRFEVHWRTVANWLRRLDKEQSVGPRIQRHGPLPKLDEKGYETLGELWEKHPDATRQELAQELQNILGIELHVTGVGRALRRIRVTRKKKSASPEERDKPAVWKALEDFANLMVGIDPADLVFVDETGVHLGMYRTHGWAPSGQRLYVQEPLSRGENITLVGALSLDGMLTEMLLPGALDKKAFRVFVEKFLAPKLFAGQVVVLDNLKVHHDPRIEEILHAVGVSLLYLPPYHPELDPIENAWSKFKAHLRAVGARAYDALTNAVRDSALSITLADARGWFAHAGYLDP